MVDTTTATPPPATTTPPPNPVEANAWMGGFNEDQKAFVLNKGYKGPADIVDSYRNAEKLMGAPADRVLKLPEKMDSPEMKAIWERLGAPKEAKEYGIKAVEGVDPKGHDALIAAFHEAGVAKGAAEKIFGKWGELQTAAKAEAIANANAKFTQSEAALKKEWGAAFEQNINIGKEAVKVMGLSKEQVNAMGAGLGFDGLAKLLVKLGAAVREDIFVGGGGAGAKLLAPVQAKAEIKRLIADTAFGAKLAAGDVEAQAKWTALHQQAAPGEHTF